MGRMRITWGMIIHISGLLIEVVEWAGFRFVGWTLLLNERAGVDEVVPSDTGGSDHTYQRRIAVICEIRRIGSLLRKRLRW